MKRTWANVKAGLFPPWVTWVLFGVAVAVYWLLVLMEARSDRSPRHWWSGFWVLVFPFGGFLLGRHGLEDTAAKPFSFLLPGYRESLRKSSFSRALRWGVGSSLYVFSGVWQRLLLFWDIRQIYSDVPGKLIPPGSIPARPANFEISLGLVGGFLAGVALCLLWTCDSLVQFRRKWQGAVFMVLGIALIPALVSSGQTKHPFVVWPIFIPLSVFFCVYFWRCLGEPTWVKRGHRALIIHQTGEPTLIAHRRRSRRWVEELFLDRMRKGSISATPRCLWAWLYREFGPILPYWGWIVVPLVASTVVLGYASQLLLELMFLVFGTAVAANVLPVASSMLLPEGRRERYYLTLATAGLTTLMLAVASLGIVVLSWLLASVLPQVPWEGHYLRYVGIGMNSLWLACLPVPWLFGVNPIGHRMRIVRGVITVAVALLLIGETFFQDYGFHEAPISVPVLVVCGWVYFPLAAWITFRRWDLAGQRPRG